MSTKQEWDAGSVPGADSHTSQGGQPPGTAEAAADELRQRAAGAGERMREDVQEAAVGVRTRAERGRQEIAGEVATVVHHLQESASELREQDAWLASLIDRGAHELDGLARSLKNRDLGDMMTSLDQFARRQPALFIGAAAGLGFALTRLAKSSAERRGPSGPASQATTAPRGTEGSPSDIGASPSHGLPGGGLT